MTTEWYNYVVYSPDNRTYVGSTVNLARRIRQHNGELVGGAKYTRGRQWRFLCVVRNKNACNRKCLSEEWHIKWHTRKQKSKHRDSCIRRLQALGRVLEVGGVATEDPGYTLWVRREYLHACVAFPTYVSVEGFDDILPPPGRQISGITIPTSPNNPDPDPDPPLSP